MKVTRGEILWRVLAGSASCLSVVVFFVNLKLVRQFLHQVDDAEDFLIVSVPVLWTIVASATSIGVAFLPTLQRIAQGALRGTFIGAIAFLPLLWMAVFSIGGTGDGLSYWASVFLPTFWLGMPLLLVGGLIGAKCGDARIPIAVLCIAVIVLLWKPGSLILTQVGKLIGRIAENVFIHVFV